jgi:sugar lactone lactonase YvrE
MSLPRRPPLVAAAAALVAAALLAALVLGSDRSAAQRALPSVLPLPNGWQPEGIASGRGDALYVGSIPTGRVLRLDRRTGRRRVVVPRRRGRAAIGIKERGGLLFVAGGPTGRAFVYRARTGATVRNLRLTTAPTFINDVVVTSAAAYFTDSQRQQLYRLPLGPGGVPAAAAQPVPITGDLRYDDDPQTFEANGIAATADGSALFVVQSATGGLFRVDPATGASTRVRLTGGNLANGDGLLLDGRRLYAVQNQRNRIAVIDLSADLSSGTIRRYLRDRDFDVPTTIARKGRNLYAVNARFGTTPRRTTEYDVVRVRVP